jgi:hypothetical protein
MAVGASAAVAALVAATDAAPAAGVAAAVLAGVEAAEAPVVSSGFAAAVELGETLVGTLVETLSETAGFEFAGSVEAAEGAAALAGKDLGSVVELLFELLAGETAGLCAAPEAPLPEADELFFEGTGGAATTLGESLAGASVAGAEELPASTAGTLEESATLFFSASFFFAASLFSSRRASVLESVFGSFFASELFSILISGRASDAAADAFLLLLSEAGGGWSSAEGPTRTLPPCTAKTDASRAQHTSATAATLRTFFITALFFPFAGTSSDAPGRGNGCGCIPRSSLPCLKLKTASALRLFQAFERLRLMPPKAGCAAGFFRKNRRGIASLQIKQSTGRFSQRFSDSKLV